MKRNLKYILVLLYLSGCYYENFSQSWNRSLAGTMSVSFSFPALPTSEKDTLGIYAAVLNVDSSIHISCTRFQPGMSFGDLLAQSSGDSIPIPDSLKDLACSYKYVITYTLGGTILGESMITTMDTAVSAREYEAIIPGEDTGELHLFTRIYYNGLTMLSFTAVADESRLADLIINKNQFFNSITFNQ